MNYIKGIKQNQLAAVEDESEDIQADFKNEIIKMLIKRFVLRRILPYPVRVAMAYFKAFPYVKKAVGSVLNLRADVALLDGVALGTALSRGMYSEVNSITFLLGVSELLEEYTRALIPCVLPLQPLVKCTFLTTPSSTSKSICTEQTPLG